jgi:hypothetical protein
LFGVVDTLSACLIRSYDGCRCYCVAGLEFKSLYIETRYSIRLRNHAHRRTATLAPQFLPRTAGISDVDTTIVHNTASLPSSDFLQKRTCEPPATPPLCLSLHPAIRPVTGRVALFTCHFDRGAYHWRVARIQDTSPSIKCTAIPAGRPGYRTCRETKRRKQQSTPCSRRFDCM